MSSPILLQPQQELLLCDDELPLLTAHAVLPHREERPSRFFNNYYRRCSRFFEERCRRDWFPAAQEAFRLALESAAPIPQWQARLDAAVTLQREHLVSLRLDTVLVTEAGQRRFSQGDLWDLRTGLPLAWRTVSPPAPGGASGCCTTPPTRFSGRKPVFIPLGGRTCTAPSAPGIST